jgi:hypothetical protein
MVHRDVDLPDAGAAALGLDRHRDLEPEPLRIVELAEELGPHGPLARQRRAHLEAAGPADAPGGEVADLAEAAPCSGRRQHADGEVGVAGQHRLQEEVRGASRRGEVRVDQQEDVGVGRSGHALEHGATFAAVDREPHDVRAGPLGQNRGGVGGAVVDDHDPVHRRQRPERAHGGSDGVGPVLGRNDGDDDDHGDG